MADILSVIQDVLTQDKQQKKEHSKMMREVQKKLKEKDSEEVSEEEGDKEDYMKFFAGKLKKYGVKSPSGLSDEEKKKFFNEIEKDWKHDSNEEVEDEETNLGDRVKDRLKAEQEEEEEDEDEAPVGDQDEPETEPEEDEPSEEMIDKIADLVVQKLKDKADEEEDEEEAPEPTEAEGGKKEKIDTKPKMEAWESSANPHARYKWLEALRQVNEHCGVCGEQGIEEVRDHKGEIPEPIKVVIQSFGKKLSDYAKKSGGIDRDVFLSIAKDAMAGKLPDPKSVWKHDTAPKDFILDSMAKEFGWMYVEDKYNVTFRNRRDFVEQVELAISETLDQEKVDGRRKAFKEAIRRLIYMKMKEARRQNVKEWWDVTLKEDWIEDKLIDRLLSKNRARAAKIFNAMNKRDKMKYLDKVQAITSRNHGYTDDQVVDALDDHGIDISKEARKQWEEVEIDESQELQAMMALDDAGIEAVINRKGQIVIDKKDKKKAEKALKKSFKKGGIPEIQYEEVELDEAVNLKKLKKEYEDNEDRNNHTGNYLLLAKAFGTSSDVKKVKEIMKRNEKQGETSKSDMDWMYKNINPYYDKIRNEEVEYIDEDYISNPGTSHIDPDTDRDWDFKTGRSSKKAKPAKTDKKYQATPDKTGTSKTNPSTKAIPAGKGKGGKLGDVIVKKIEGDNPNKLSVGTKSGTPKKAVGDAKKAKIVDPIGKGEKGFRKEEVSFKEKLDNWGINLKKEGYMILPGIDRERYTEMRGLEGPFMTRSGKVVYYDSKLGEYYDRDSDIYLSWAEYQSLDQETSAQKAAMKQGPLADPKSREYKKMERDKAKAEKAAKKQYSMRSESLGVARARKFYQKDDE